MTTLEDSIEINAEPERVFDGLVSVFSSPENFKHWHKDHVTCQWLKGKPFEVGAVLYIEEYLHKKLHKLKFVSTHLEPNRKIEFKLLFPASIVCTGGAFTIIPKEKQCVFSARLCFRMGWLFSVFASSRVDAIKTHMKEEGENLNIIIKSRETNSKS